jgi:hypothetical protein
VLLVTRVVAECETSRQSITPTNRRVNAKTVSFQVHTANAGEGMKGYRKKVDCTD